MIFKLEYRKIIKKYLYKRKNYGNARRTRFQDSVPELQMCQVVETLPHRNLRSENMKGVNIDTGMQRNKADVYSEVQKLRGMLVPSV